MTNTLKNSPYLDRPTRSYAQFLEEGKAQFLRGQRFARQENGALAGMAEMPELPNGCDNKDFRAGYHDFYAGLET